MLNEYSNRFNIHCDIIFKQAIQFFNDFINMQPRRFISSNSSINVLQDHF